MTRKLAACAAVTMLDLAYVFDAPEAGIGVDTVRERSPSASADSVEVLLIR